MRVISTLKTVWTCGLVRLDSTMRLAMMERIFVIGTSSPGCGCGGWQASQLVQGRRLAGAAGAAATGFAPLLEMADDVGLSDAAGGSGAWDLGEIDVVVLGDLADKRRGADVVACRG